MTLSLTKKLASAVLYTTLTASLVAPSVANAGDLVRDATIVEVANTIAGAPSFVVRVAGGTGICQNWIEFTEARAKSPNAHRMAMALAMLALNSDKKVRIHNFEDNSCRGASGITLTTGPSSIGDEGFMLPIAPW